MLESRFHAGPRENQLHREFSAAGTGFTRIDPEDVRGPVPWTRCFLGTPTADSYPCGERSGRDTFHFSHFQESPGHGEREVQELRPQRRRILQIVRRRHHGHDPQPLLRQKAEKAGPA